MEASAFEFLLASAMWMALHLLAFVIVFRRLPFFGSERTILLYHLGSCVFVGSALLICGFWFGSQGWPTGFFAVVGLHGIYSMSFLVLWAASEGGFSLRIMSSLMTGPRERSDIICEFSALADAKRTQRLDALQRSRWVHEDGEGRLILTPAGRCLALLVGLLHTINNFDCTG